MAKKPKGKATSQSKTSKKLGSGSCFCPLCDITFRNTEAFKLHIMQQHRPGCKFYLGESESSSDSETEITLTKKPRLNKEVKSCDLSPVNCDAGVLGCSQDLFNNNSENAVSPQSSSSVPNSKEKVEKGLQSSYELLEGKRASEEETPSSPVTSQEIAVIPQVPVNPPVMSPNNQTPAWPYLKQPVVTRGNLPVVKCQPVPAPVINFFVVPQPAITLNAKNIIEWFQKWKELTENLKEPFPKCYVKKIESVYRTIFDNLHLVGSLGEGDKKALFKVFDEMKCILVRNAETVGERL